MAKAKKTAEPKPQQITPEEFKEHAKPMSVQIGNSTVLLSPKLFSTGSLGWNANDKLVIKVGDKEVKCQLGINLTVVGSKPTE